MLSTDIRYHRGQIGAVVHRNRGQTRTGCGDDVGRRAWSLREQRLDQLVTIVQQEAVRIVVQHRGLNDREGSPPERPVEYVAWDAAEIDVGADVEIGGGLL